LQPSEGLGRRALGLLPARGLDLGIHLPKAGRELFPVVEDLFELGYGFRWGSVGGEPILVNRGVACQEDGVLSIGLVPGPGGLTEGGHLVGVGEGYGEARGSQPTEDGKVVNATGLQDQPLGAPGRQQAKESGASPWNPGGGLDECRHFYNTRRLHRELGYRGPLEVVESKEVKVVSLWCSTTYG